MSTPYQSPRSAKTTLENIGIKCFRSDHKEQMGVSLKYQFILPSGCHFPSLYAMNQEAEVVSLCSGAAV